VAAALEAAPRALPQLRARALRLVRRLLVAVERDGSREVRSQKPEGRSQKFEVRSSKATGPKSKAASGLCLVENLADTSARVVHE